MNPPFDCDVAVLGGGPAGASAGATLARAGHRVVLLERDRFPRFHIGESLLASTNEAFAKLGIAEAVRAAGFPQKWGATFLTFDGSIERYADFASANDVRQPQTFQVERAKLDAILLEHARASGVEVREEQRALDVTIDRDGVTVVVHDAELRERRLRARVLIDASGRAGVMQRKLGLRRDEPRLANIGIFSHYRRVPRPAGRRGGDIRIVSRPDLGWFWLIPISAELMSVGVVLPRRVFDALPDKDHERVLRRAIAETPAVARLMQDAERAWPVRVEKDFSYGAKAYSGDRFVLAGDAGSFLDPVFSTGVAIALESGIEAAETIERGLRSGDLSAAAFRDFDRRQQRRYRTFRRFVLGFYSRSFRDLFFQPDEGQRFFRAVVTYLAGNWQPSLRTRLMVELFFVLVRVQARFALAPRLETGPAPEAV